MMGNEWSVVCELFANGAFRADRQIKEKELAIMDALKVFRMLTEDTEYMEAVT